MHSRLPRGVRPRLEGKPRTPLSSRVATRISWSPLGGLKGVQPPLPFVHALEKEMATHSSVLAWRIPGTGEPGGLLSLGTAHPPGLLSTHLSPCLPLWPGFSPSSSSEHQQTRSTASLRSGEELPWQQECSCQLTPAAAGMGLSHPHTPRPPTLYGFPPPRHPHLFH